MKKIIWGAVVLIIVVIQFIPSGRPDKVEDNPADLLSVAQVPDEVAAILKNSCYDCHSNVPEYPWYSYIAPTSWLVAKDVNKGKEELNFSVWDSLDKSHKARLISDIIDEVEDEEMPLRIYTSMHPKARLDENQRQKIVAWANELGVSLFQ